MDARHDQASMEAIDGRQREKRLYQASLTGCVDSLHELIDEDRLLLARVSVNCFDETPLHIAAMLGHLIFAKQVLTYKPELATELDTQRRSPLHLASANGYVEIERVLLSVDSDMCPVRDDDGRTPLHLAVMKGRVSVIKELIGARPEVAHYRLDRGETLFHLGVKHNRLEAIKALLAELGQDKEILNVEDFDGNSVLHVATMLKQYETIKILLTRTEVSVNAMNGNGCTASDIIEQKPRDLKGIEIQELLINAGATKAYNHPGVVNNSQSVKPPLGVRHRLSKASSIKEQFKKPFKKHDWVRRKGDSLMVAATVIAAMAYQAGINPPDGLWAHEPTANTTIFNEKFVNVTTITFTNIPRYPVFFTCNTVSFVASSSIIFLLISGLPIKKRIVMWILMAAMWVTITSMTITYLVSMDSISPDPEKEFTFKMIIIVVIAWLGLVAVVFLVHTIRFLLWIVWKVLKLGKKTVKEVRKCVPGNDNV